jgi:drug/metabolite transporter (DMT)-like permease
VALAEVPPLTIVLVRVGLAALALGLLLKITGRRLPAGRHAWRACFGMGILNNVIPFCLFAYGQTQIASGLAAILNATTPLFTVLAAHALTADEKATRLKLAGVVAGSIGVIVMVGPDALVGLDATLLAELACLGAAISYALSAVYGRRFRTLGTPPVTAAFGQLAASAAIMTVVVALFEAPWRLSWPSTSTIGALLGLALLATALAYIIFFRILGSAGATNLMLVTFLIPVSANLLGWLILGERLGWRHFAGMMAIAPGLALIDGRLVGRLRSTLQRQQHDFASRRRDI